MTRIPLPATIDEAPEASRPLLEAVKAQFGMVPNLHRVAAASPAALEGLVGLGGALSKGKLSVQTRERIALAVAQINGCHYCLAAHSYIGKNVAKLDDDEIAAARNGGSSDDRAQAAVRFAAALTEQRGEASEAQIAAVRAAGYSDEEIVEIIADVAYNALTNYLNTALDTALDFPRVPEHVA